jgi:hypothetical protein
MTSERRLAANRKNAKRSTGPHTARGKLRVRSNAVRHGLATTALRHPAPAIQIERMATAMCGESTSRLQFDQAISIAEGEFSLTKVRSTRFRALQFLNSIAPPGNDPVAVSSEAQAEVVMDAAAQDKALGAMQDGPAAFQRALDEVARYGRTSCLIAAAASNSYLRRHFHTRHTPSPIHARIPGYRRGEA